MSANQEPVPISALQHHVVCPRQCALIHLERQWAENRFTAEGRVLHEGVDRATASGRNGIRRVTALPLRCYRLGLTGQADAVDFLPDPAGGPPRPHPVEFKRGRPKKGDEDRIQLCAQALCLEEMLGRSVPDGALFYGQRKRRLSVTFNESLRQRTEAIAAAVHALFLTGRTPPPPREAPCDACSLQHLCLPKVLRGRKRSVAGYFQKGLNEP